MKKIILIVSLVLVQSAVYAGQTDGDFGMTPTSKLERIENQIKKYTKIINELPEEFKQKINNFNRLKGIGNDIQQVLVTYITATDECLNEAHSPMGKESCGEFSNLDLGSEIKEKKGKVIEMIAQAQRELIEVKAKQKDIPLIEKLLKSLKATKSMMMQ